jgi:hypothetical protein
MEEMTIEDAILEKLRGLPPSKQEEVLRFAEALRHGNGVIHTRDRSREMKWIEANRAAFAGQWVALEGDRLVTSGPDALKVFETAASSAGGTPFVIHIPIDDPLPLVPGW